MSGSLPSFARRPAHSFTSSLFHRFTYSLIQKGSIMAYLQPADYPNYGLPDGTSTDWITAATALINNHCRRPDLNVIQYTERLRLTTGSQTVRLTYLTLAP